MSSTDIDAPPLRLIFMAIVIVVGLHVLTAVALVAIKTPEPKVELSKEIPPIEIEFVSLPAQNTIPEVEAKGQAAQQDPEPQPKVQSQPTEKAEPKPKQKKVDTSSKLPDTVVKDEKPDTAPIVKVEEKVSDIIKKETPKKEAPEEKRQQPLTEPIVDTSTADQQRKIMAAQAEKEAHAKAIQEARKLADAQAAADARAAKEAAKEAAANAARVSAEAAAAAATESNTPVNFTASNANWASAPNFSFPERAARRARSGDTLNVVLVLRVNKQGGIDSVRIAQSSGNAIVDKEAQRQVRSGKFKPFTKSGVPVVGNVTLPISYAVP